MYSKYREQDLKNMSSLQRVPDYKGFGLERLHCILLTGSAICPSKGKMPFLPLLNYALDSVHFQYTHVLCMYVYSIIYC